MHRAGLFCDAGPVTEKAWAIRAGLGWRGRNSLVINKEIGSFIFLGEIVTSAEFLYEDASARDRCGTVTSVSKHAPRVPSAMTGQ